MIVNTCKRCHQLFEYPTKAELCPLCRKFIDKKFDRVKRYIRDNKRAGVYEVSDACEVTVKQIMNWVREERLFFDESSDFALPCLNCGTLIRSGKYCITCQKKLHKNLSSVYVQKKKPPR